MNVKDITEKHAEEIRIAVSAIEESANIIFPSDIKMKIGYDMLEGKIHSEKDLIEFLRSFSEEGKKFRLSLVSLFDGENLVSAVYLDDAGRIGFNESVLRLYVKDPIISDRLSSLKGKTDSAGKALDLLAMGIDKRVGRKPNSKIKAYPLFDKIRYVREIIDLFDTVRKSSRSVIVHAARNTKTPREIEEISARFMETPPPSPLMEFLATLSVGEKFPSEFPVRFKISVPEKGDVNSFGLSRYQAMGINDSSGVINGILGMAGSGKTFLAVKSLEFDSVVLAALRAGGTENSKLSSAYSIHSSIALKRVKRTYPFVEKNVLYYDPDSETFLSDLKRRAESLRKTAENFPEERYRELQDKFSSGRYAEIPAAVEKYLSRKRELSGSFSSVLSAKEYEAVYRAVKTMYSIVSKNTGVNGLFGKIREFFVSLLSERKRIYADFPYESVEVLAKHGIDVSGLTEEEITERYEMFKKRVGALISEHRRNTARIADFSGYGCKTPVTMEEEDISLEEATEYLFLTEARGERGFENAEFLENLVRSPSEAGKPENFERLREIFPFVCFPLEVATKMNVSREFYRIHVDEGYLFPGFSAYSVLGKALSVNFYGDMNQFDVGMYFSLRDTGMRIFDLYGSSEKVAKYSITVREGGRTKSLFEVAEEVIPDSDFTVLVDNFRSTREIVDAQIHVNPAYRKYIANFLSRCGDMDERETDVDVMKHVSIYGRGEPVVEFPDGRREKGSLWYTSVPDMKKRLSNVIRIAKINGFGETIVTATFAKDTVKLEEIYGELAEENPEEYDLGEKISFIPLDSLQALEADFTHLETGIENARSEGYRIMRRHPVVVNVPLTRSRTMFSMYVPKEIVGEDEMAYILSSFKRY